jgi:hypothetical protein
VAAEEQVFASVLLPRAAAAVGGPCDGSSGDGSGGDGSGGDGSGGDGDATSALSTA